jgi:hypothetical protein
MPKWVERWWLRAINRTQCSPSIIVAIAIVFLAVVVFQHREAIIHTVVITMLCIVGALALAGLGILAHTVWIWNHDKNRTMVQRIATVRGGASPADDSIVDVPDDISDQGSVLADETEAFLRKAGKE